ncbi:MAG: primary-amine oxidase [Planctomycetes bacterium]|nr:primary-amine oxidase [Planctomycetota bacterium]
MRAWILSIAGFALFVQSLPGAEDGPRRGKPEQVRALAKRLLVAALSGDKKPTSAVKQPAHPLDPLSATEMATAVDMLRRDRKLAQSFRFVSCTLDEPDKALVLAHRPGQEVPRRAFLVLLDNATGIGHEAIVDLAKRAVVRFAALPKGIQPAIMLDEFGECEEAVKKSPEFLAALKKRGVADASLVMVEPWSAGNYGTEPAADKGRRLMRALCFVRSEPRDNGFARPLDGVVVIVDLNTMKVIRIEDYGVTPLPPEAGNWARDYIPKMRGGLKPIDIVQPDGPSFTVTGNEVRWQNWRFRLGFTPREGLVLHTVGYNDAGTFRSILYRGSITEMVVPYGDPGEQYYRKNAFDIGEYGIGTLVNSLQLGCDCLGSIRYFDANYLDSRGKVITLKNAICLHEEDAGILWKHTDWRTNQTEVRRSRRLSASFIATVGNYDYGFYWHFYQDGSLQCEVKLTGIMNTTALKPKEKSAYGIEVAPQLNATFHQHIFAARLDMAVDGLKNSVQELNTARVPRGPDNPHGNAFRASATLLANEKQAMRATRSDTARFWRIINPHSKNRLGTPVGYRLVPGENSPTFVQPDAAVMRRAGFAAQRLWVTPFQRDEKYPAGDYPNQHPGGDGLPRWTAANRKVADTDVVAWYVFAHMHVPRPEDWPVMPVASIGFALRPDGFFARNPALDVPPVK